MTFTPEIIEWAKQNIAQGHTVEALLPSVAQNLGVAADANLAAALKAALAPAQTIQAPAEIAAAPEVTGEVVQTALPAGFDIMATLQGRVAAEKSGGREPNWAVSIEELRSRVTFRDGQPVGKKDESVRWLRPYLAPNPIAIETIYGTMPNGAPKNHFVVPAQNEEAAKDQLLQIALSGQWDELLLATAAEQKKKKEENDKKPNKAPVDTAAADAALSELSTAAPMDQAAVGGLPQAGDLPLSTAPAGNTQVSTGTLPGMGGLEGMPSL